VTEISSKNKLFYVPEDVRPGALAWGKNLKPEI